MNLLAPISTIMSRDLHVVLPDDNMALVKDIFDRKRINHIPVMRHGRIVGIINKTDFKAFYNCSVKNLDNKATTQTLLRLHIAEEVMTNKVFMLEPTDNVSYALEILRDNIYTALPVLDGEKLVGMVTALDIVIALAKVKVSTMNYKIF